MRRFLVGSFVLLVCSALSRPLLAQGAPGFRIGLSGGADFPVSDQHKAYDTGWNGTFQLMFNFAAPVGLRLDGSYHQVPVKDLSAFRSADATRIVSGTFDLVIGPHDLPVEPYALGGVGAYDIRFQGQELGATNAFSESTTRFGWNAGAGLAFRLGNATDTRLFVEARYTSVSTSGDRFSNSVTSGGSRFTFVPVNFGVVF